MRGLLSLLLMVCLCFAAVSCDSDVYAQQCNVNSSAASAASSANAQQVLQNQAALSLVQSLAAQRANAAAASAQVPIRSFAVVPALPGASASASTATTLAQPLDLNTLALIQSLSVQPAAATSASASSSGGGGRRLFGGGILSLGRGRSFSRSVSVTRTR